MKKILSLLSLILLSASLIPNVFANPDSCPNCSGEMTEICEVCDGIACLDCGYCDCFESQANFNQGTVVTYKGTGNEFYTITVPAVLSPGQTGSVVLEGQWALNRVVSVTADEFVTLTNSIKSSETKELKVSFDGIAEKGNNVSALRFDSDVSVENMRNALFGVWRGKFNYNVSIEDSQSTYLYYYQPYVFEGPNNLKCELVFHEDGHVDVYCIDDENNNWGGVCPPEALVYNENTILFEETLLTISEDRKQLTTDDGWVANLVPTPISNIMFNEVYSTEQLANWDDGSSILYRTACIFYDDFSAMIQDLENGEETAHYEFEFEYYDTYGITIEEYEGEPYSERIGFFPDGSKITIYGLVLHLECPHSKTEVHNKTENYTGDIICSKCGALIEEGMYLTGEAYALWFDDTDTLTFTRSVAPISAGDTYKGQVVSEVYTGFETDRYRVPPPSPISLDEDDNEEVQRSNYAPWIAQAQSVENIDFDAIISPVSTSAWFYYFTNCEEVDLSKLDMSLVDETAHMFAESGLTIIPAMNLTNKITTMESMFDNCVKLTDISNFTIPVGTKDLSDIFENCELVMDFSNIIIPDSVESIDRAFYGCSGMTSAPNLDNATGILYADYAFAYCEKLVIAPNIPSATEMFYAFSDCYALQVAPTLPPNTTNAFGIFYRCYALITYHGSTDADGDFSNYNIFDTDAHQMFDECYGITHLPQTSQTT